MNPAHNAKKKGKGTCIMSKVLCSTLNTTIAVLLGPRRADIILCVYKKYDSAIFFSDFVKLPKSAEMYFLKYFLRNFS